MNIYKRTSSTISFINYHFVFCPRYRRKIFDIPGVEERFKAYTQAVCLENGIDVIEIECRQDYAHVFVSVYPQMTVAHIIQVIKGATSHRLREEFPVLSKMPSLWTRSYFVSTAETISAETIRMYVETQKKRS